MNRQRTASTVRYIGMFLMIVLSLTQLIPSLEMAGGSIWVGLASFFIVEAIEKVSRKESGLRFSTLGKDLKGRTTWLLILLLVCVQIANVLFGCLIFNQAYIDYDLGRSFDVMGSTNVAGLLALIPIAAWGEEIAWRGFFLGKQPKQITPWVWIVLSSLLFAMGHVSQHPISIVLFGTSCNFICSLIFCILFRRTNNCMVSTIAHIIGNYMEILFILLFL